MPSFVPTSVIWLHTNRWASQRNDACILNASHLSWFGCSQSQSQPASQPELYACHYHHHWLSQIEAGLGINITQEPQFPGEISAESAQQFLKYHV